MAKRMFDTMLGAAVLQLLLLCDRGFELSHDDESGCSISTVMENPERLWFTSSVWYVLKCSIC